MRKREEGGERGRKKEKDGSRKEKIERKRRRRKRTERKDKVYPSQRQCSQTNKDLLLKKRNLFSKISFAV